MFAVQKTTTIIFKINLREYKYSKIDKFILLKSNKVISRLTPILINFNRSVLSLHNTIMIRYNQIVKYNNSINQITKIKSTLRIMIKILIIIINY